MADSPLVSVVIPTFNRPSRLREAVASVAAQSYPNVEIVVVNDGRDVCSTGDQEVEIGDVVQRAARGRPVTYIHGLGNRKQAAARQTGVSSARGSVIAYLDDDDVLLVDAISDIVGTMAATGADATVSQGLSVIRQAQRPDSSHLYYRFPFTPVVLAATNLWITCTLAHRRVEGMVWDSSVGLLEDFDAVQRLFFEKQLRFASIPTVSSHYIRAFQRPSVTNVDDTSGFLAADRQIWPRYERYWEDWPEADLIRRLQGMVVELESGQAPEDAEGCPRISRYERFITRLYGEYCIGQETAGRQHTAAPGATVRWAPTAPCAVTI